MKYFIALLIFFVSFKLDCQSYDIIITNPNYKSYFEYDYLNPTVVVYNLYKGGGSCDRKKFKFKNDRSDVKTATEKDYTNSGYDKGHLANAEDFAYSCELDELTFRFYNCVPQNPKLNRGPWMKVEKDLRKISQTKEITIMCINIFDGLSFLPNTKVSIPSECIKLVWDSKTKEPLKGYVFTNTSNPKVLEMSHQDIIRNWNLNVSQFLNW